MFAGLDVLTPIPEYVVDFDLPPEERWTKIVEDYKGKLGEAMEYLAAAEKEEYGVMGPFLGSLVTNSAKYRTFSSEEMSEIISMAKITKEYGISVAQLIKLNIGYDLLARCTSCICTDDSGANWQMRTMDWDLPYMREITINATIIKNGKEIAKVTTWPCCIGFLTAIRLPTKETEQPWSISLNYRKVKGTSELSYAINFFHIYKSSRPASMAIRNAILDKFNYKDAVAYLSSVQIIAPCYMIICGPNANEGTILTRGRRDCNVLDMEKDLLVQTNIDWDDDDAPSSWVDGDDLLENSVERRSAASENILNLLTNKEQIHHDDLLKVALTPPVYNEQTIYVTVTNPAKLFYLSMISAGPRETLDKAPELLE